MNKHPIDAWPEVLATRDPAQLAGLLADEVVFHSPVVHISTQFSLRPPSGIPVCHLLYSIRTRAPCGSAVTPSRTRRFHSPSFASSVAPSHMNL